MSNTSSYAARAAQRAPVFSCASLPGSYLQLRDAVAWETFDESALTQYVTSGVQALRLRIQGLSDLSRPLGKNKAKELVFMLESLLYVRSLLVEDAEFSMDAESKP